MNHGDIQKLGGGKRLPICATTVAAVGREELAKPICPTSFMLR
jgi:hypothetical protein